MSPQTDILTIILQRIIIIETFCTLSLFFRHPTLLLVQVKVEHPVHAVEGDGQNRKDHGGGLVPVDSVVLGRLLSRFPLWVLGRGGGEGVGDRTGGEGGKVMF